MTTILVCKMIVTYYTCITGYISLYHFIIIQYTIITIIIKLQENRGKCILN